jgi:hypothetical protein
MESNYGQRKREEKEKKKKISATSLMQPKTI